MQKTILVSFLVLFFYLLEYILFNILGVWFMPNFLIILIVFLNFSLGIRYSLWAAVVGGLIKDSFGVSLFGLNVFSLVFCAFMVVILKRYIYTKGSKFFLILLISLLVVIDFHTQYFLHVIFYPINIIDVYKAVLFPEIISTLIVTIYTFQKLKQCALKYFV